MSTIAAMSELILHHYPESPYAEKIRTVLGYKQLAWRSVTVPRIAPKPDLVALTGGYRKVPVLQVGADVYCDTRLIAWELERRARLPAANGAPGHWGEIVAHWVDVNLFGRAVAFTLGSNLAHLSDEFLADRAALRGAPLEREALARALPLATQALAAQMAWVERGLAGGPPFVNGMHPGHGDFTLYSTLWFARQGRFDFGPFPATADWMARMKAFGHGQREDMTAERALEVAAAARPAALPEGEGPLDASGLRLGSTVSVTPEQLGHGTTVNGLLVQLDSRRLAVRVESSRCGTVHVHFPRVGYRVREVQA